jgi:hypothetical protein
MHTITKLNIILVFATICFITFLIIDTRDSYYRNRLNGKQIVIECDTLLIDKCNEYYCRVIRKDGYSMIRREYIDSVLHK